MDSKNSDSTRTTSQLDPLDGNDANPIVTVDRRNAVVRWSVGIGVIGAAIFLLAVFVFLGKPVRNADSTRGLLFGITFFSLCVVAIVWIRSRWICAAVIDEHGILASTLERKYDLPWSDLCGARTYFKKSKNGNPPTLKLLLLLEDGRGLEAPIALQHVQTLSHILLHAPFSETSQGQRLGTTKAVSLVVFGLIGMQFSLWWDFQMLDQFNNGRLFVGNPKAVVLKILVAVAGPVGSLFGIAWGLYHAFARPILYPPGWQTIDESA